MALVSGELIEIADYNELALEVNRLFSDNTVSLDYLTSDIILNETLSGGEAAGATRTLSPAPTTGDFLVVLVNNILIFEGGDYTVDYGTAVITFTSELFAADVILCYNRTAHRFGWGQTASVYPIVAGASVLADEEVQQAYIEANLNNLIDKTNIMLDRSGSVYELSRVTPGALIYAADSTLVADSIADDIIGAAYWSNEVATVNANALAFTRSTTWATQLIGAFQWTFSGYNSARYFFNSGNSLRFILSMTGDIQDAGFGNWRQTVDAMGSLVFGIDSATQTGVGGASASIGFYDLTDEYRLIFSSAPPSAPFATDGAAPGEYGEYAAVPSDYAALFLKFYAKIEEDVVVAGDFAVKIRVIMDDSTFATQDIAGTTTAQGGYTVGNSITNNSAIFDVLTSILPAIDVADSFITANDS